MLYASDDLFYLRKARARKYRHDINFAYKFEISSVIPIIDCISGFGNFKNDLNTYWARRITESAERNYVYN